MPRFLPCRTGHLAQELAPLLPAEDRPAFWTFVRLVEDLEHHFASTTQRLVEALYAPFDPDRETVPTPSPPRPEPLPRLLEPLERLLERANFQRVPSGALLTDQDREVLARLSIDPDPDAIELLAVWTRGRGTKAISIRPVRRLFRLEEREVETHRRVALVVRTRSDPHVLLRLFKDVPVRDLELLLPTVRVKMKLFDKLKLSGSGGAAVVSAWKLLKAAWAHAPALAKVVALPFQALALPLLVLVGGVYGGKTLLDYTKIRASYITALAEHLYAITMASNAAVIARLGGLAADEDTKEVVLAYALLAAGPPGGLTPAELGARAEALVWDRYRARVAFDTPDALAKLDELALLVRRPDGRLGVVPPDAAVRQVDAAWDDLFVPPAPGTRRLGPPLAEARE